MEAATGNGDRIKSLTETGTTPTSTTHIATATVLGQSKQIGEIKEAHRGTQIIKIKSLLLRRKGGSAVTLKPMLIQITTGVHLGVLIQAKTQARMSCQAKGILHISLRNVIYKM